ncbi:hypothetical protein CIRG_01081 [Coccidioides immitis RMSCC 2394]|uniref:Helicase C-terminal domain-containing protein n=1 Tax=Coccidioides immitis RMSCC 2394 TaxID=404692 RepID=A0A0J6XXI5_COCIT|nr:hypothetical protein CIRG_01081 [Coccidioides immitis RMSCC 2394]
MKSYPDITRRSEQESEFDSEPEGHVAGPTLSDEVDSEGDIEGLESDKDDAVAQEGSSKRVAKAGSKDGQVLERVKYHIETMPPEVLRGTYTVMPTPKPKRGLDQSLPPISRIEDIFDDLVAKAEKNGFDGFLSHIGSRELRVASMCSGTEAPLLALDMIADSFKRLFGRSFHLHHLFSAEIEPFKQSYIQRNFSPAILFRDVNELVNDEATTAFGSMRKVPTNPDLLVAGFSCVDFSQLNAHKKSLEDMGESGHTFFPILQYVKRCRPPLVILENVHSAPWAKIMEVYQKIDYNAYHAFIDTKNFYLPQTRERGYLLCIDQRKLETEPPTKKGAKTSLLARMMKSFQRPASSPVTHFLLKHDDPRLRVGVNDISVQVGKDRQAVDWTRYKARHLGYRMENGLGDKRPLTRWQDNGTCQMPDFYWHGWTKTQTERVWDTLDVNFLRAIVRKSDFMSKCRVIDLSQGLDRELDQRASGISGCLTPRGQHFISTRGGPLLGIEALALQGIPTDRILLSSESQRDLHDLAGNAMSSPVVGAAILCALIAGHKALLPGPPRVDEPETPHCVSLPHSVRQDCPMRDVSVELSAIASEPIKDILSKGHRSCRLCFCEGQSGTRRRDMLKCSKCNHTACVRCGRNPSHVYEPIPEKELALRIAPIDFEIYIKMNFPMRLQLKGLTQELFEQFREPWTSKEVLSAWKAFMGTVSLALGEELRFSGISRQRSWTVTYEGTHSLLKLVCSPTSAEWLFFALPGKHEPSNSPLRQILSHPIARMAPSNSLLNGAWHVAAPISSDCSLFITGCGPHVDSLGARVGLTDKEFRDKKVWSRLDIDCSDEVISNLGIEIRGQYELLQDCGGPFGSLHKKISGGSEQPLFFFVDPTELGPEQLDSWVLATDYTRLDLGQTREVIAQLQPDWDAFELGQESQTVKTWFRRWNKSPNTSLSAYLPSASPIYHILDHDAMYGICRFNCQDAYAPIFNCSVPATSEESNWSPGAWKCSNLMESPIFLQKFAWLLQKAVSVDQFSEWIPVDLARLGSRLDCLLCAPLKPRLTWALNEKDRICAFEHPEDATAYERSVKNRPAPFLGFASLSEDSYLQLRICLNFLTLLHQAIGNLPRASTEPSLNWRLCIDIAGFVRQRLPKLVETNNKDDVENIQPPGFKKYSLRPEQLRSLTWMRAQESPEVQPFEEEEVVEALLPVINWRAEGKATVEKLVRGGILGDDVGYGKTAISLGLIDAQFENDLRTVPDSRDGPIAIKATLIVVPYHLFDQWLREIDKFLGSKYRVLQIKTIIALRPLDITEIEKADIVLMSASIFRGVHYYELMRLFGAVPEVPKAEGRVFDEWLRDAVNGIHNHLRLLRTQGGLDVLGSIKEKNVRLRIDAIFSKYNPSKRLKGQKLQDHMAKKSKMDAEDRSKATNIQGEDDGSTKASTPVPAPKAGKRKRQDDENKPSADAGPGSRQGQQPKKVKAEPAVDSQGDAEAADKAFHLQDAKYDWKRVRCPFVHMFEFNRLVIDEFTYSKERNYSTVLAIPARSKWILSGTPPLNDFADVKSFSPFLGINLGIDEDDCRRTDNERLRAIQRDRTEVEQFQPFITRRSAAWHKRRHDMAQSFLDRFMRKNEPEIGEIPFTEHICEVVLSPAERALYIELFVQVMSQNLRTRKQGRGLYDTAEVARLNQIIGDSDSPEEALVKRCSLFSLEDILVHDDRAPANSEAAAPDQKKLGTGNTILDVRYKELRDLAADLQTKFRQALWLRSKLDDDVRNHFDKTLNLIETNIGAGELGDNLVRRIIRKCLDFAKVNSKESDGESFYVASKKKDSRDSRPEFPATEKATVQDLNNCNDSIRRLIAETRTRTRASRVFQAVRYFQTSAHNAAYYCHYCCRTEYDRNLIYILGECGHSLCGACLDLRRRKGDCKCDGCTATLEGYRVIPGGDFKGEVPQSSDDSWAEFGGSKIGELVKLLQDTSRIPEDDQVLIFIQFTDLVTAVSKALGKAGIRHITIISNDRSAGKSLADFQNGTEEVKSKALILALGDVTASGLNLQAANHIVFFHPLIARSQYDYESGMSQAMGRSRRYGQQKHVHIYHFLALKTVEVNIFERRRRECLVKRDKIFVSLLKNEIQDADAANWRGYPLEGSNAALFDDGIDEGIDEE